MSNTLLNKNQTGDGIWTSDNLVAGSGISIQPVPQPVIDANTLGVWHFENNLDNAASGSSIGINTNHNYTFTNAHHKFGSYSTLISDRISSSGTYDLFTNYLSSISEDFTFDFWAQQYSTGSMERIWFSLGTGQNFSLYIGQDKISWTGSNQMTITNGVWYHLAIELQENTLRLYINGELKYTNSSFTYSHDLWYGYVSSSYNHNVYFDEFRLSNIARYQGNNFTPYTIPYAASEGPAQYQINNTKADPDLSSYLQNTATGTNALTINGVATSSNQGLNLGDNSQAIGGQSIAIGPGSTTSNAAYANTNCVAIGFAARANYASGTAIGREAAVTGTYGISIGNSAQAVNGNSVAIGAGSSSNNAAYANGNSVAVGSGARAVSSEEVAIGQGANTSGNGNGAVAVGRNAQGTGTWAIGIGTNAYATANQAIQLGSGTNNTANTFQVFSTTVVDANGKVPMSSTDVTSLTGYDATKTQVLKNVQGTLTWVDEA